MSDADNDSPLIAKPLPATFATKYEIDGKGFVCIVNIQLGSTTGDDAAGAETLKLYLQRLTNAVEKELKTMQKQPQELVH